MELQARCSAATERARARMHARTHAQHPQARAYARTYARTRARARAGMEPVGMESDGRAVPLRRPLPNLAQYQYEVMAGCFHP